jgi:asparagine synthase (glutamine-hydrolysing)
MCGIVGIYNFEGVSAGPDVIHSMSARLSHRGPDDKGFHITGQVHLASTRLSIIDLNTGAQPIVSADGRFCIVLNGEIYNFRSVRKELESLGHSFSTQSDTEVVLHAYRQWGEKSLDRLSGMFAFCIWDAKTREIFLARDRFGIKPLYYASLQDGTVLFASEIKALLEYPGLPRLPHRQAVENLLTFGFNIAPHTFFECILQLLPGHFMRVGPRGSALRQYWDVDLEAPLLEDGIDAIVEQFRSHFERSVREGVIADVPVATYLSGGIDSTAVTGMYSRVSGQKVKTVTITFDQADYDEREFSRKASQFFDTEYLEFPCSIEPDEISRLAYALENPIVSLLNLPLFLLSRKVRESGLKVVLTGDGSDEILGGYDYFKVLKTMHFIGDGESECRKTMLKRLFPQQTASYQLDSVHCMLKIAGERFPVPHPAVPYRYQGFQLKERLYASDYKDWIRTSAPDAPFFFDVEKIAHRPLMDQALYLELKMRLLNLTLPLADKMSMANSVEARPLFLDHEFVNFLFRVPSHWKMLGLNEKFILKRSMKGIIPDEICQRKKQPFQPPARWFIDAAGDLLRECLSEDELKDAGYFSPSFVSHMLQEHEKQSRIDYSGLLVTVFFVQLWHRTFFKHG